MLLYSLAKFIGLSQTQLQYVINVVNLLLPESERRIPAAKYLFSSASKVCHAARYVPYSHLPYCISL